MSAFGLVAGYEAWSALTGLAAFTTAVRTSAPTIVAYTGDVIVMPGAAVVIIFALLEIIRPMERWRRRLVATAFACFIATILLPIGFRLSVGPFLLDRGYVRCSGRVVGYTLPAERFASDRRHCLPGA